MVYVCAGHLIRAPQETQPDMCGETRTSGEVIRVLELGWNKNPFSSKKSIDSLGQCGSLRLIEAWYSYQVRPVVQIRTRQPEKYSSVPLLY